MPKSLEYRNLNKMFSPTSIAVIGASRDGKKVGAIVVRNIVDSGFKGDIYPINPKSKEIQGLKSYENISGCPKTPDLALISLPSPLVLDTLQQINEKGTKNVVIYSAGFGETGDEGKKLEKEISTFAETKKINILGPNCFGFVNNVNHLNTTFGENIKTPGNLRFISQSGAIAASIFDWSKSSGMGFDYFVTLGNKVVLNENDILEFWSKNLKPNEAIGLYLESISDGKKFLKIISKISKKHPIFILKPGKSDAAKKAMQSHTGALAGADDVLEAALEKNGVIRCEGIQDMFDLARAFSWSKPPTGNCVEIISNAGGPAVISADMVSEMGLELTPTSEKIKKLLKKSLPRSASLLNPIDVLGDAQADRFKIVIEASLEEANVDALIVILTPQLMTEIEKTAEIIGKLHEKHKKPIFCSFIGGVEAAKGEKILGEYKIPTFRFPQRAIRALSTMWKWYAWAKNTGNVSQIITNNEVVNDNTKILTPETHKIESVGQGIKAAEKMGWPVVLKIFSEKISHKTEVNGIIQNIHSKERFEKEYERISKLGEDVLVQKQIENGVEVIVGIKKDENFGNVLMFGAGGILTELISDKNLYVLPVTQEEIVKLVEVSKVYKLLSGYRNKIKYDLTKLYRAIQEVIAKVEKDKNITEYEINPLIITHEGVYAVDERIITK